MDKEKNNDIWWRGPVNLFLRLSGWIAFPVVVGSFLGRWLDKKYDSEPWAFIGVVGFSFFISMIGLFKNVVEEYKKIDEEASNKQGDKENL